MVDRRDGGAEPAQERRAEARDDGAHAFAHPPVHPVLAIRVVVEDREPFELDAAVIGADGVQQPVPAVAGLEQVRRRAILALPRGLRETLVEGRGGCEKILLIGGAEEFVEGEHAPRRARTVDREPQLFGDLRPGIALSGVQPAAAEVEGEACRLPGVGAPAQPLARFEHDKGDVRRSKPRCCRQARGATPHHNHVEIAHRCHARN